MPLPAEKRAEYQRDYRARRKAPVGPMEPPVVVPAAAPAPAEPRRVHRDIHGETLEHRLARQRVERRWSNPFGDGLPDTGELIAGLSQGRRDRILVRMVRGA